MALDIDKLMSQLQSFFSDGLVVIVGSGLSCAEGLPGMYDLAQHLDREMKVRLTSVSERSDWETISSSLKQGTDLEAALQKQVLTQSLESKIRVVVGQFIGEKEQVAVSQVFSSERVLRFSKLLPHLNPNPSRTIPVITTNYDRLIEVAAELSGYCVNKLFMGHYAGQFEPASAKKQFIKDIVRSKKSFRLLYRPLVNIFKPHGSLGWYEVNGKPVQCEFPLNDLPQFIITPGLTKYRRGYDLPFDKHLDEANNEIDRARRFLIVGYGFNDDHLETHLNPQLKSGKPCLLLTHGLSLKAKNIIQNAPNMMALSFYKDGFRFSDRNGEIDLDGSPLWDVATFVTEVLE